VRSLLACVRLALASAWSRGRVKGLTGAVASLGPPWTFKRTIIILGHAYATPGPCNHYTHSARHTLTHIPHGSVRRQLVGAARPLKRRSSWSGREGRRRCAGLRRRRATGRPQRGMPVTKAQILIQVSSQECDPSRRRLRSTGWRCGCFSVTPHRGIRSAGRSGDRYPPGAPISMARGSHGHLRWSNGSPHPALLRAQRSADSWDAAHAFAAMRQVLRRQVLHRRSARREHEGFLTAVQPSFLPRDMVGTSLLGFDASANFRQAAGAAHLAFRPRAWPLSRSGDGRASQPIDPVRSGDLIEVRRNFAEPSPPPRRSPAIRASSFIKLCEALEAKDKAQNVSICSSTLRQPHRGDPDRTALPSGMPNA